MWTCFLLAWKKGLKPLRVILAGVAVNSILGSITGLMFILFSDEIQGVLSWLNGSLNGKIGITYMEFYPILSLVYLVL